MLKYIAKNVAIKITCCNHKNRNIDQCNNLEIPELNPCQEHIMKNGDFS